MRHDLARMARLAGMRADRQIPVIHPTKAQANELARIYMRVVRAWRDRQGQILAAYEQALQQRALADGLIRDDATTIESQVNAADDALRRLVLTLTPALRDWIIRVERWHRGRWAAAVLSATGVDLTIMVGPGDVRDTLAGVLARNTALIRDVSDQARGRISDIVFRGFTSRTPARVVAKEMREALDMSRRRSLLIASDQMSKLSAELDAERQRQAGLKAWIWRHSGKAHPRLDHKARDGTRYTDATAPNDLPGMLPYCGCRRQAVLELD